jgi:tetratricopeptide (TPR) repeat protein
VATSAPKIEAFEYHARGQRYVENWGEGSLAQARDCFEKAIELDPQHAPSLAGLARFHAPGIWTQNTDPADLKTAMELSQQAIAVDPNWGSAHVYYGYALWRLYRLEEALESLHEAKRLSPGDFYPSYFLSCVSSQMARYDEAIAFAQAAAAIEDRVPYIYHLLGTNYVLNGDFESALWALQKGVECETDVDGYGWGGTGAALAECLRMMGRFAAARKQCLETLDFIQQKDHMIRSLVRNLSLTTLGKAALDQNDHAAATAAFEQSIALIEGQIGGVGRGHVLVQSLAGLARSMNDGDPLDKGIRIFEERGPYNFEWGGFAWDHMSLFDLACAANSLGRKDQAAALYARAQKAGCRFEMDEH